MPAYTPTNYVTAGSATNYVIGFPFLRLAHLVVTRDGVVLTTGTDADEYILDNVVDGLGTEIKFTVPGANGETLVIERSTPLDLAVETLENGEGLDEDQINDILLQALYGIDERSSVVDPTACAAELVLANDAAAAAAASEVVCETFATSAAGNAAGAVVAADTAEDHKNDAETAEANVAADLATAQAYDSDAPTYTSGLIAIDDAISSFAIPATTSGLSAEPTRIQATFICNTTDLGYAVGDVIEGHLVSDWNIVADQSGNVTIYFKGQGELTALSKNTPYNTSNLDVSDWDFKVSLWQ